MSFKDWVPVMEDVYVALMSRGPKQDYKLKITHELIATIMAHHGIALTKKMEKPYTREETTLVKTVRTQVEYCDLAVPISIFDSSHFTKAIRLSSSDKAEIVADPQPVKRGWVLQLSHVMHDVFGNPKYFTDDDDNDTSTNQVEPETTNEYGESVDWNDVYNSYAKPKHDTLHNKLESMNVGKEAIDIVDEYVTDIIDTYQKCIENFVLEFSKVAKDQVLVEPKISEDKDMDALLMLGGGTTKLNKCLDKIKEIFETRNSCILRLRERISYLGLSSYGFDPKTINTNKANDYIKCLIDDCRIGKTTGNQLVEALISAAGNRNEFISAERAQELENKGLVQRGYLGMPNPMSMTALMGMRTFGDTDSLTTMNHFIQVVKSLPMCIEQSDLTKDVKHIFNEIVKLAYSATSTIVENKSKAIVDDE